MKNSAQLGSIFALPTDNEETQKYLNFYTEMHVEIQKLRQLDLSDVHPLVTFSIVQNASS